MAFISFFKRMYSWKHKSTKAFSAFLYHYAGYVYDRPYKFIIGSLFCSLILTFGFYFKENEKDLYKLYALSNSFAHETKTTVTDFLYNTRKSFVLVESNCNVLDPDILKALHEFENEVKGLKVDFSTVSQCTDKYFKPTGKTELAEKVFEVLDHQRDANVSLLKELRENFDLDESSNETEGGGGTNTSNSENVSGNDSKNIDDIDLYNDVKVSAQEEMKGNEEGGGGGGVGVGEEKNVPNDDIDIDEINRIIDEMTGPTEEKPGKTNTNKTSDNNNNGNNTSSSNNNNNINLKGSHVVNNSINKNAGRWTFEDYKDDKFSPIDYLPPMLEISEYCNLNTVFGSKYPDIDLNKISKEEKKKMFYNFEDICEKIGKDCNINSLFIYYEKGNAKMGGPIELDDSNLARLFPFYINPHTDKHFFFNSVLGKMDIVKTETNVRINAAYSTLTIFSLLSSYKYEPYVLGFEEILIKFVKGYKINPDILKNKTTVDGKKPYVRFHVYTNRSIEDEVDRISRIDYLTRILLFIGVLLIFLYTLFNNVTSVSYRSKPLCAVVGIVCGFLGYLSGSGFLYFIGIKSVPPAETVPFLVIGVGVDDIFVILNSYSLLFMIKDNKKRIQICLKDSALAITVTTVTNIIAFLISGFAPFYSISSFSLYTASSLFFCYVMVLTFFLGFLCIEAKLEDQKRSVCSCTFDFFNIFMRKRSEVNTQENTLSVPYDTSGEGDKKYINYENISIYEWIHNLYLFEESINEKKKNNCNALTNERCGSSREEKLNEGTICCQGQISNDLNELEGEKPEHKNSNTAKTTTTTTTTITTMSNNKNNKNNKSGSSKKNTKSQKKNPKKDDGVQEDVAQDEKENKNSSEQKKKHDNKTNMNSVVNDVEKTNVVDPLPHFTEVYEWGKITENNIEEMEKLEEGTGEHTILNDGAIGGERKKPVTFMNAMYSKKTQSRITEEGGDMLKESVKGSTCNYNTSIEVGTKDALKNKKEATNQQVYMLSSHDNAMFYGYIYKEPKGNIGKYFRVFIKNYYVPILSSTIGKVVVYILFSIIIGVAIYGCTLIKKGIKFNSAFPTDSYVRQFSNAMKEYFSHYGDLIEVCYFDESFLSKYRALKGDGTHERSFIYYPEYIEDLNEKQKMVNNNIAWEKKEVQEAIYKMDEDFRKLGFVTLTINGFMQFLGTEGKNNVYNNPKEFHKDFVNWLQTNTAGLYFNKDFVFLNEQLVAWRFHYHQEDTEDTEAFGKWLKLCEQKSDLSDSGFRMICFHFSSIFIEADEAILEVTAKNLGITVITVLVVTAYIVKGLYSCFIITIIIALIDLCIFGYMCLCNITINIISMVILVLSVGFSIDHTSHIVQAFTHSHGRTRNEKMKESLHLMISPVLHSGLSTWFIISTLYFSNKDFTIIFFQTLSLVLIFSIIFSSIFLPVLLSSIGPM